MIKEIYQKLLKYKIERSHNNLQTITSDVVNGEYRDI